MFGFIQPTIDTIGLFLISTYNEASVINSDGIVYDPFDQPPVFFLLYAAWVRSRAERPSVSYTKVVLEVAWTGHNLQYTKTN